MAYCITLQSRAEARITGWYAGTNSRWSTDHMRRKVFDNKHFTAGGFAGADDGVLCRPAPTRGVGSSSRT